MFALAWLADSESAVRQRKTSGMDADEAVNDDKEVDDLIRHHAEMQERIAEEMVHLARNLRENVSASGRIVREDVTVCHQFYNNNNNNNLICVAPECQRLQRR